MDTQGELVSMTVCRKTQNVEAISYLQVFVVPKLGIRLLLGSWWVRRQWSLNGWLQDTPGTVDHRAVEKPPSSMMGLRNRESVEVTL